MIKINKKKFVLIEYDGEQHFYTYRKNIKELEDTKIRDEIKNTYCSTHNIPLLRIKYTQYSKINKILKKFLKDNGFIFQCKDQRLSKTKNH